MMYDVLRVCFNNNNNASLLVKACCASSFHSLPNWRTTLSSVDDVFFRLCLVPLKYE